MRHSNRGTEKAASRPPFHRLTAPKHAPRFWPFANKSGIRAAEDRTHPAAYRRSPITSIRRFSSAVEQRFCKPKVGSSILSTGTIDMSIDFNFFAQISAARMLDLGDVESAPQEKARRLGRARRQIPHGGVVSMFTSGPPELILRQETPTVNRRAILHRSIPARYGFFRQSPTVGLVPHLAPSAAPPLGQNTDTSVSLDLQLTEPSA